MATAERQSSEKVQWRSYIRLYIRPHTLHISTHLYISDQASGVSFTVLPLRTASQSLCSRCFIDDRIISDFWGDAVGMSIHDRYRCRRHHHLVISTMSLSLLSTPILLTCPFLNYWTAACHGMPMFLPYCHNYSLLVISQICIVEVKLAKTKMELAAVEMEAKTVAPRHRY